MNNIVLTATKVQSDQYCDFITSNMVDVVNKNVTYNSSIMIANVYKLKYFGVTNINRQHKIDFLTFIIYYCEKI